MRLSHLLFGPIVTFLVFNQVSAQVTKYQFTIGNDSLAGFDEEYHKSVAAAEGLYGESFIEYIAWQKRTYINVKYGLVEHEDQPGAFISNFRPMGGGAVLNNAPCQNEDFELGNMNFWTASRGRNNSSQVYPTFSTNISSGSQVSVVSTPLNDPFVGTIPHSPLGGTKVIRINNTTVGTAAVVRIQQTFSVTPNNYLFDFAYWAVMHNAVSHNCTQTPYMAVRIRNFTGTLQACPNFSIVAPSTGSGGCPGIGQTTWTNVGTQYMTNTGWQKFSIDLTPYMGQNVTVEAYVAHCSPTAHFGYAYFDADCNTMNVTVNGQPWSMPTAIVNPTVICGSTATMVAPNGLSPYQWFGPAGSGINGTTNQTIVTTVPGAYTLNMSPSGICNPPMQKVINLSFVPPTTVAVTPATICASGSNSVATLTAQGTANYTWTPGGMTGPSATVSPGSTTIYTLTAQSGTCIGNFTTELTVAPDPTVFATAANPTVCSGAGTTLTAIGANSYTWMPGSLTGSQVPVNPNVTTVYTVTGSNSSGCVDIATVQVNISGSPTVSVFPAVSPTVCAGTPVVLVGLGAISFSWYPTNPLVTGQVVALSPSVTTQYTVIGASNGCTNSAVHTITVDPGPSMTISATPSITCPGVNATLTVVGPASNGFTWNPGGSNSISMVVNPATTTVYSVTGVNANGCTATSTINKLVAPVPNIVISPATNTVCFGSSLLQTASGGSSYTWNPGGITTNTIVVSPTVNTTYTVTASNGTCTSTAMKTISVVPLPTVNASASPSNICRGQSALLAGTGASNYTWQPGGITSANTLVSPAATTTYTLFGRTGSCTNTATVTVIVRPQPTVVPAANPSAVCPGFCSTLTATGANTYTFSSGAVVCPTTTTIYSVTGTGTNGCTNSTPATIAVVVNPTPNIVLTPASASVCAGSSVSISASGGVSYTWNPGNLTGSSRILSPSVTTVYTVTGVNAQGCASQRTIQITVVPSPTVNASASPSIVCSGSTVTLSATGATTYTWMPGNLTGATRTVAPTSSTVYTVTGNLAGCVNQRTVGVTVNPRPNIGLSASPASVCPGFCSTLIATGGSNYTFSPAGPAVCPANTGTYTVNGVNAFGCTDLTPPVVTVVVRPPASFTLSTTTPSICIGNSATLSAAGASTYTWQPGNLIGTNVVVSPSVNTTYTATGTNSGGCQTTRTINITVIPSPTVNAASNPGSICPGGTATLSASGAAGYTWQPGNLTGANVTVSPASTTIYTVTGNSAGCSTTRTVGVAVLTAPVLNASASPGTVCAGNCATVSVSGASTYTWMPGNMIGPNAQVCPTVTTTYTVTGRNVAGCTATTTVVVAVAPGAAINASASSPSICSGSNVTLTATGGTSYTWMPGNSTSNPRVVSPTVTTVYTVTGVNATGCVDQATVQVIVQPIPSLNVSASPTAICAGDSTILSASGASTYFWQPGNLPGAIVTVSPGITTVYTVTGIAATGCSSQRTLQVVVNPLPSLNVIATPTSICAGGCSSLSASGGSSYTWMPGSLTGANVQVCPVSTTVYTLTGASGTGCRATRTVAVNLNPSPNLVLSPVSQSICAGATTTIGASGALIYNWMPGPVPGGTITVSPSVTTVYTVSGVNAFGCGDTKTTVVVVVPRPTVSIAATATSICMGDCSTLTASGAASYTWNTGATGSTVNACPNIITSYQVVGSNASGCLSLPAQQVIIPNPLPSLNVSASPSVICSGVSSTLSASGASSYTWMPGNLTGPAVVVTPSANTVYTVTGTSIAGCVASRTIPITVFPAAGISISASTNSVCFGLPVVLTATGGTSYTWQPGLQTTQVITVNPTVTTVYTVNGTNGFGCSGQATYTINVIAPPNVTANSTPTSVCAGNCATLSASGASSYTWLPGFSTGATALVCPSVTTTYTLVGQQGLCGNFTTITVPVLPNPTISASASPTVICLGGTTTLSASGGATYTWMPGNLSGANVTVSPNVSTTYTVTGSSGQCSGTATVFVAVGAPPSIAVTSSSPSVCSGKQVTLAASGASSFTWSPGSLTGATVAVSPPSTTIYTVTGSSGPFGCTSTATIPVNVIPLPSVVAVAAQTAVCPGACTSLFASGAISYTWLPINSIASATTVCPISTTAYTLIGAAGGCTNSAVVTISTFSSPAISLNASPAIICAGGTSTLTASGASTYSWAPGGSSGPLLIVSPAVTTVYTVTAFSPAGCAGTATVAVQVNPNPLISVTGPATVCAGSLTGLTATGAAGNSYTWQPGNLTGSNVAVSPLSTTVYTVTGAQNNCTATATHTLAVNPLPTVFAQATPASICTGGSSTLSATGAANYTWQPGNIVGSTVAVFPTASTVYTVTAASAAGCSITQTVGVTVSGSPSITISSSNNTICAGSQATLTASGTISYTWLPISSAGSVVVVSPGTTTTYTVIGSNGPGCTSTATFVQVVSPVPNIGITAASNTVCAGFATTLTATGATSYTWEPGTITSNPAIVTVSATTVYTVTGETNGCAGTNTILINASPAPTVNATSSPTSVCSGGTVTLSATGANNYTWYPMAIGAAVITDNPGTTTTYTVIGFSSAGCPGFATITVPVLSVPQITITASNQSVCLGSTGTLTATGANNYTWQPGNLTGSVVTISPSTPTTYTVIGDNGACQGSNTITIGINPLPVVSASISHTNVCAGTQVTLFGSGAVNYTWQPGGMTGPVVADNPTVSTTYTVTGEDINGCNGIALVSIVVDPFPTITPVATPTGMCEGSLVTTTLVVSGTALTYTWLPSGSTSTIIADSPTVTTVYTVSGTDAIGCVGSATVMVGVFPIPTIAVTPPGATICAGSTVSLTASGANNFTWIPSGGTQSVEIVSPSSNTTYTLIGDNGGICLDTITVDVFVNPIPSGVAASSTGTITCSSQSASLSGVSTDTDVIYSWTGPSGFTSTAQNPTVSVWGTFTLIVTNTITGCSATATVDVPTDNSIPSVTATASGSITCSTSVVTLSILHSTFPSSVLIVTPSGSTIAPGPTTVSAAGVYTVIVTDLLSLCTGSATVTVGSHTEVAVTASIAAATCSSGISLNDGSILVGNFGPLDRFDLVAGTSYTGALTYTNAITIPSSGIITNNLANPADTVPYTLRIFDSLGCVKDIVLELLPVDCTPAVMGIAKAVSTPTANGDGTYRVLFTIIVTNTDTADISNVVLEDNLTATFPAPATFTRGAVFALNPGNIQLNSGFDGVTDAKLTNPQSMVTPGLPEVILLEVFVTPNGHFGPFENLVTGAGVTSENVPVNDISTSGSTPDPDNDGNPRNNSEPTTFTLAPQQFFGLTKTGSFVKQDNNTYDVSYTVTAHNLGNDTLRNVVIADSLFNATIRQPAAYTLKAGPVASGMLVANSDYDGRFDINLVEDGVLAPGTTATVSFTVNVVPDTVTVLANNARGIATGRFDDIQLQDISNDGTDPDSNNNGIWNEEADNVPTTLVLPLLSGRTPTIFVPEGFSPDGDGVNDYFVIKGLPETGENVITVFNRWGNRVYQNDDYDNSWNGYPNVSGTLGKDKLPPGTYYYVLEFKGSSETRTGFIVLQY